MNIKGKSKGKGKTEGSGRMKWKNEKQPNVSKCRGASHGGIFFWVFGISSTD
jgi:hypothetical protein